MSQGRWAQKDPQRAAGHDTGTAGLQPRGDRLQQPGRTWTPGVPGASSRERSPAKPLIAGLGDPEQRNRTGLLGFHLPTAR